MEEQIEKNQELEKAKQDAQEYLNNWKRERADFINYKKDEAKRIEEFVRYANEDLIMEVIEILDDLDTAIKHLPKEAGAWAEGIKHLSSKFGDLLKKYGVERVKVEGENLDPMKHEVIHSEGNPDGKLEEVRAGYTLHDKVIRPARVRIVQNSNIKMKNEN